MDSAQFRVLFRGSGSAEQKREKERDKEKERRSSNAYLHSVLRFLHLGDTNPESGPSSSEHEEPEAQSGSKVQPPEPSAVVENIETAKRLAHAPDRFEPAPVKRTNSRLKKKKGLFSSSSNCAAHFDPCFDLRASIISLECDEDEEREEIMNIYEAISQVLFEEYEQKSKELHSRLIWNADSGKELTAEQSKHLFTLLFRQMRSILVQQFSLIFSPLGLTVLESVINSKTKGTRSRDYTVASLAPLDVAACVCALVVLEMAITDDDCHSFAISVYHGQRLSLGNCPKSKRYLYFTFMAFKSTVDSIRSVGSGGLDAFRAAISRYFHDRNSIRELPPAFELPTQALLNVLAPIMMSQYFQSFVKGFYQDAVKMEADRSGDMTRGEDAQDGVDVDKLGSSWSTIQVGYHKAAGDVIGEGAYGKVYRCYDASNGTFYALKEITLLPKAMHRRIRERFRRDRAAHPEKYDEERLESTATRIDFLSFLTDDERRELSRREMSIHGEINFLRTLRHPNIVSYYGCTFNRERQLVSLLMEFCPKTLRSIVVDMGRLPLSMIAHYAAQVLHGLDFLHEHHIVHRDIKAANILVKDHGEAKVSDFGTAAVLSTNGNSDDEPAPENDSIDSVPSPTLPTASSEIAGSIQGTPLFLAPEVAKGCLPTVASDIWSFGCMLIELATGEYPWHEWTGGQPVPLEMIIFRIGFAQQPPQLDPELAPEAAFDPSFTSLLRACLQFDPCDRMKASELLEHEFFQIYLHGDEESDMATMEEGPETPLLVVTPAAGDAASPVHRRRTVVQRGELPLPGEAPAENDFLTNDSMFTSAPSFE